MRRFRLMTAVPAWCASASATGRAATHKTMPPVVLNPEKDIVPPKPDDGTGELRVKRDAKLDAASVGLVAAALDNVNKITITKTHVVQQCGTPCARGDVVGHTHAGVPMVRRDPDVARPESYCAAADLTDTYFELPEGFDANRHYVEIARDNASALALWATGMLAYAYALPSAIGWPALLCAMAVAQRLASRHGTTLRSKELLPDAALAGKICLVTGASAGIGLETAIDFARRGADVIAATHRPVDAFWVAWNAALPRNMPAAEREALARRVSVTPLDLAEFTSVRNFAEFVRDRLALHANAHGRMPVIPADAVIDEAMSSSSSSSATSAATTSKNTTVIDGGAKKPASGARLKKQQEQDIEDRKQQLRRTDARYAPPLDILVNNAGLMRSGLEYNSLQVEMHLAANVVGPAFLTELLLPNIRNAAHLGHGSAEVTTALGRVVNVSSMSHVITREPCIVQRELIPKTFDNATFQFHHRYSVTKLLNVYYSDSLARRGVRSVSVFPGGTATSFFRQNMPSVQRGHYGYYPSLLLLRTPREGAASVVYAALCREDKFVPGAAYSNCRMRPHAKSALALNDRERAEFIDWLKGQLPMKHIQ